MRILALDIASDCGWAATPGRGPDEPWRWGCRTLPRGSLGGVFSWFERWLDKRTAEIGPDAIVIERPILPQSNASFVVLRKLYGLCAIAEKTAFDRGLPYETVPVSTVRKHFCGDGRAKKPDVIQFCMERGFRTSDHNEADAIALAHYALHHPDLFMEAA